MPDIYFFGLICHVSPDENQPRRKTHATIVNAKDHTAMIWGFKDGKIRMEPLRADVFTPAGSETETSDIFDAMVPSLKRISGNGKVNGNVQHGNPHPNAVLAYVHYPVGGILHVAEAYPNTARYGSDEMCVAKVTRLQVPDPIQSVPGYKFTLDADHPVLIMNASRGEGTPGHKHNEEYEKLLDNGNVQPAFDGTHRCETDIERIPDWITGVITAWASTPDTVSRMGNGNLEPKTLRVECANTNWP